MRSRTRLLRSLQVLPALSSTPCMMSTSMPVKEKSLERGKARLMARMASRNGDHLVMTIGSTVGVHRDIIAPSIIQGNSHADVQSAAQLVMLHPSAAVQSNPKNVEWEEPTWSYDGEEWHDTQWEWEEYEASKGKKGKGKGSKTKGRSKGKNTLRSITPRPSQSSPSKGDRSQPKPKPEGTLRMTNEFLFAMISTKSKPTWRHSTWNGADYMICTVAEPQKKLPGHMLPKGARSFEVTVNLAVGKVFEKRRPSVGAMRSMQKIEHIHFFHWDDWQTYWIQSLYGKMVLLLCNAETRASGGP